MSRSTTLRIEPFTTALVILGVLMAASMCSTQSQNAADAAAPLIKEVKLTGPPVEKTVSQRIRIEASCTEFWVKRTDTAEQKVHFRFEKQNALEIPTGVLGLAESKIREQVSRSEEIGSHRSLGFEIGTKVTCAGQSYCVWVDSVQTGNVIFKKGSIEAIVPFEYPVQTTLRCV